MLEINAFNRHRLIKKAFPNGQPGLYPHRAERAEDEVLVGANSVELSQPVERRLRAVHVQGCCELRRSGATGTDQSHVQRHGD